MTIVRKRANKTVKEKFKAIEMLEGAIKLFYKRNEISNMQNWKAV